MAYSTQISARFGCVSVFVVKGDWNSFIELCSFPVLGSTVELMNQCREVTVDLNGWPCLAQTIQMTYFF